MLSEICQSQKIIDGMFPFAWYFTKTKLQGQKTHHAPEVGMELMVKDNNETLRGNGSVLYYWWVCAFVKTYLYT